MKRLGTSSNRYSGNETTILTKTENASTLMKVLAYGWRYRKMYEAGEKADAITKHEKIASRIFYKYLNLSYLSPRITGEILDSNIPPYITLQGLFGLSSKYDTFKDQERVFFEG